MPEFFHPPDAPEGLAVVTPARHEDTRGFFSELWNKRDFVEAGIECEFVQDNHSVTQSSGVVRGLHFQAPPRAQAKLVRCASGEIWDVAVDIRFNSPDYGTWFGVKLNPENGRQLYIPAGFLHGFVTLKPDTEVCYKCSDFYDPASEGTIRFDDSTLNIDWPVPEGVTPAELTVSPKDAAASDFKTLQSPFRRGGLL